MSTIKLVRVDARLVHGQIAAKWSKILNNNKFVVIDDETANDDFMRKFFEMASPAGTKTKIYTVEKAARLWQKNQFGEGSVIVIFKDIPSAARAFELGFEFDALDIGQVPGSTAGRIPVLGSVNLNADEAATLRGLKAKGVNVYIQGLPEPENVPVDIDEALAKVSL